MRMDQSFESMLAAVRRIATEIAAPNAGDVDAKARFPSETVAALRAEGLLSAAVPRELGGAGCGLHELAQLCANLAQACGSSAMVLAMHYIQLACIARHGTGSEFFRGYLRDLVTHQHLLASMTSEVGTFGETRTSICAVEREGGKFVLNKDATTGSYCAHTDAILVTCRRGEDAGPSDQSLVLVRKEDCLLRRLSEWDTLGFRGTCSPGFELKSIGRADQILPAPYGTIHSRTQHPVAHLLWASLWVGLGADALQRARQTVRAEARKNAGVMPISATRLAEADLVLGQMKSAVQATLESYRDMLATPDSEPGLAFGIAVNNLKLTCSQQVIDVVMRAMLICGIAGYRNDSKLTLGRHLRDATGAALMVNNDRILGQNATMHVGLREE